MHTALGWKRGHVVCLLVATGIAQLLVVPSRAGATTGPTIYNATVLCIDSSKGQVVLSAGLHELWRTTDTNYDGCLSRASHKFEHAHPIANYPINLTPGQGFSDNQVTAAEVDAYWIAHWVDHEKAATANLAFNCHGYTTGELLWIQPTALGIGVVLQDGFEAGAGVALRPYRFETPGSLMGSRDHSYRVVRWQPVTWCGEVVSYTVGTIAEKQGTGTTMRSRDVDNPDVAGDQKWYMSNSYIQDYDQFVEKQQP